MFQYTVLCMVLALALVHPALGHDRKLEVNEFCDEDMAVCTCPEEYNTCPFQLVIHRLVTFTRYVKNLPTGKGGNVFFINDDGELEYVPFSPEPTACVSENDCTPANTVDGADFRAVIGINGRIPGPTLVVHKGQILVIDVINELLNEVTTIHWHGIKQFNTPWMDGAGIISQCPIAPGTTFRYILNASEAGTFWYHAHNAPQRIEGMFGALVVKGEQSSSGYSIEHDDHPERHTLTLLDWQRQDIVDMYWKFNSLLLLRQQADQCTNAIPDPLASFTAPTFGNDGVGLALFSHWSGLINGLGKHSNVAFKNSRLSVFEVEEGTTYRFRLIGAQGVYAYRFSVDNHRLTVISTDGYLIEPVIADYIIVNSGERYDFILTANETEQPNYWMRAETFEADLSQELPPYPFLMDREALAILHYSGTPLPTPPQYENISSTGYYPKVCTGASPCVAVNCPFHNFHPSYNTTCVSVHQLRLVHPTTPDLLPSTEYDEQYFFTFGFGRWLTGIINGRSFILPTVSFQANPDQIDTTTFCNLNDTCEENCYCTHVLDIPYNKSIRFVFINRDTALAHPIHIHGHAFHVLGVGYGTYNETTGKLLSPSVEITCQDALCARAQWTNATSPTFGIDEFTIRKDTVVLPAGGYVVVHFVSNNPGFWPLHCHIEFHQRVGMDMVLNVAPSRHNPAPEGMQQCGNFSWTVEEFIAAAQYDPDAQSVDMPNATTEAPSEQTENLTGQTIVCEDDSNDLSSEAVAGISVAGDVFTVLAITAVMAVFFYVAQKKNASKGATDLPGSGAPVAGTYVNTQAQ